MENNTEEKVTVAEAIGEPDPGAQAYLDERNELLKALAEKTGYFEKMHLSVTADGILPALSIFKKPEEAKGE